MIKEKKIDPEPTPRPLDDAVSSCQDILRKCSIKKKKKY